MRPQWNHGSCKLHVGTDRSSRHHVSALGVLQHQQWDRSGNAEQCSSDFGFQYVSNVRGGLWLGCFALSKVRMLHCCFE
jgi:hypothetical protein